MPAIHVCSLAGLPETVAATGARHVLTLINAATSVPTPAGVPAENHLFLGFNDILEPMDGMTPPAPEHVVALLGFARTWDRATPLVVHCFAGISRSTAAAFIIACALHPERDEAEIAGEIRAQSPSATPNLRLVRFADAELRRQGRMVSAIESIGRGAEAFVGHPIRIPIRV